MIWCEQGQSSYDTIQKVPFLVDKRVEIIIKVLLNNICRKFIYMTLSVFIFQFGNILQLFNCLLTIENILVIQQIYQAILADRTSNFNLVLNSLQQN